MNYVDPIAKSLDITKIGILSYALFPGHPLVLFDYINYTNLYPSIYLANLCFIRLTLKILMTMKIWLLFLPCLHSWAVRK